MRWSEAANRPRAARIFAGEVCSSVPCRFRFRNIQQMPNHCGRPERCLSVQLRCDKCEMLIATTCSVGRPCEPKDAKEAGVCHSKCALPLKQCSGHPASKEKFPVPPGKSFVLCLDILVNATRPRQRDQKGCRHQCSTFHLRSESCDKCGTTSMTRNRVGILAVSACQ